MVVISRPPNRNLNSGSNTKSIQILITIVLCTISYYTGTLHNNNTNTPVVSSTTSSTATVADCAKFQQQQLQPQNVKSQEEEEAKIESIVQERVHQLLMEHAGHEMEEEQFQQQKVSGNQSSSEGQEEGQEKMNHSKEVSSLSLFQDSYSSIMNGIARISKDEFVTKFDSGPPMDIGLGTHGQDVLILYNTLGSIPTSNSDTSNSVRFSSKSSSSSSKKEIPLLSSSEATENCDTMNIITVGNPGNTNQCTVLLNNYENYHTQRWMRVPSPPEKGKLNHNLPLRQVSRGYASNGSSQFTPPDDRSIEKHWKTLYTYLDTLDDVLSRLKPIAEKVSKDNTIIVMTCNMGQSELLMNFVCSAKAKGLDVGNVLVFPTDVETKELAEGLGLATFYDEKVRF